MATGTRRGEREGVGRRLSAFGYRHTGVKLGLSLGAPLTWFVVIYLGSLVFLLANSFWSLDVLTSEIVRLLARELPDAPPGARLPDDHDPHGRIAAVTIADIALSFPLAYYAARLATPRMRNTVLILVVLPLWANYLVRCSPGRSCSPRTGS